MANIKFFLFSKAQLDHRTEIEKGMGNVFVPGMVIVKGQRRQFTELADKPENNYSDAKVILKADLDTQKVVYTLPQTT